MNSEEYYKSLIKVLNGALPHKHELLEEGILKYGDKIRKETEANYEKNSKTIKT